MQSVLVTCYIDFYCRYIHVNVRWSIDIRRVYDLALWLSVEYA
jgi:hypothetical protein